MSSLIRAFDKTHFISAAQPTDDRVALGSLWSKPATGELYICTALGPTTFTLLTGGSGAPVGSSYVTIAADGTLTDERRLTAGSGISITDNGAGSTVVIASSAALAPAPYPRLFLLMGA